MNPYDWKILLLLQRRMMEKAYVGHHGDSSQALQDLEPYSDISNPLSNGAPTTIFDSKNPLSLPNRRALVYL